VRGARVLERGRVPKEDGGCDGGARGAVLWGIGDAEDVEDACAVAGRADSVSGYVSPETDGLLGKVGVDSDPSAVLRFV
jgi:hypothetical protein